MQESHELLARCCTCLSVVHASGGHGHLEQPSNAMSWREACAQSWLQQSSAILVLLPACMFNEDWAKTWLMASSFQPLGSLGPTQAPSIDAEKIVQLAKQGGPEASAQLARFRHDVAAKIAPVKTVIEAGRLSLLISEVARQHFPKMKETTNKTARWQHTEVKQGIKDMWKARRRLCLDAGGLGRPTTDCINNIEKGVAPPRKPTSWSK